jgi:GlpG protein
MLGQGRAGKVFLLSLSILMRLVGVLPNPEHAKTFGAYLQSLGIPARVDEAQPSTWEIWVRDEDHVSRSRSELDRFVANPGASEFVNAASSAAKLANTPDTPQVTRVRFSSSAAREHHPIVTLGLVMMCLVVAWIVPFPDPSADDFERLHQLSLRNQLYYEPLYLGVPRSEIPPPFSAIRSGQIWRLFTPALAHGNLPHLIMNLTGLVSLGVLIERREGSLRLLLLTLFVAAISHTAQYTMGLYRGDFYPSGFLGISGVVFGLFGYAWVSTFTARPGSAWDRVISTQQVYYILAFGLICTTGLFGPIANTAHFAGLFAGMLCAWLRSFTRHRLRLS